MMGPVSYKSCLHVTEVQIGRKDWKSNYLNPDSNEAEEATAINHLKIHSYGKPRVGKAAGESMKIDPSWCPPKRKFIQ